jgi:hypothetical protein
MTGSVSAMGPAVRAVANLCIAQPSAQAAVSAGQGFVLVAAAMARHPANTVVQDAGCALLAFSALSLDEKTAVAAAGALPLLVASIERADAANPTVAQHAALAVMSLATKHGANKVSFAEAGAVGAIVGALRRLIAHEGAVRALCYAMIKLSRRNASNKAAFKAAGAIDALDACNAKHSGGASKDAASAALDAKSRITSWGLF